MKADEKRCPKCAEVIKKAALVCKHCGHSFTPAELKQQQASDAQNAKAGGIGCLIVLALLVLLVMCSSGSKRTDTTSPEATEPSESSQLAMFQVAAKRTMEASLRDPDSAKYQNVRAHKVDGTSGYVFCGQVNSKNGFGGYTGFQRFVAGAGVAATEDMVSDFPVLWSKMCSGSGTEVWF